MVKKTCILCSQNLASGIFATCHLLFPDHIKYLTFKREMDIILDPLLPPLYTKLTAQEKSALAIPKRTKEDEE